MAKWKYKIDISTEWQQASRGKMIASELAGAIANKLYKLPCYQNDIDLQSIVADLYDLPSKNSDDFDELDEVMDQLYDWGDTDLGNGYRMCWIGTF